MAQQAEREYTTVSWGKLKDYPAEPLPDDHPWPKRETLTLRVYGSPLKTEHLAFSIGLLEPGQSVEHHRHEQAEEVYLLLEGQGQIRIADEVIDAEPLDAFRIPAHVYRSVYNNSDRPCRWLFMGAPIDEFLANPAYNPPDEG
jgi:quercetin dioxygenase-like cupin family protein